MAISKAFTETISVDKFDAEMFIASIDTLIGMEKILGSSSSYIAIKHLESVKEQAVKLLKI